jgi:hypothetical protein
MDKEIEALEKIEKLVKDISGLMKLKLIDKMREGYYGWDNLEEFPTSILEDKLKAHIEKGFDLKNMIDIANFAAMIWYRRERELIEKLAKALPEDFGCDPARR